MKVHLFHLLHSISKPEMDYQLVGQHSWRTMELPSMYTTRMGTSISLTIGEMVTSYYQRTEPPPQSTISTKR